MKKIILLSIVLFSFVHADIFYQGNKNIGASVGAGHAYNNNYTIAGIYGNYFVIDNLSIGIGYKGWFGRSPSINEVLLEGTYYIPLKRNLHPYLGIFGRYTFISSEDDYQSYGAKAGLALTTSKNSYVGFAYVVEYYSECNRVNECSNSYPEVVFGFSF